MSGKTLPDNRTKRQKTSTGCRKGAGTSFLCLRATGKKTAGRIDVSSKVSKNTKDLESISFMII
jgi:hypothetical protein